MSKISEALAGKPMESDVDDMASSEASPEEVAAYKLFERAKTPEDKASALKEFIQACGAY